MTKICSKCHTELPVDDFRLLKSGRRTSHCKACAKEYLAEWRAKNAESQSQARRARYRSMTDAEREAKRESDRVAYARNKERMRDARLRSTFGISSDDYAAMLANQGGTCAICHEVCASTRGLAVDHDHKTGRVRGLLCMNCNNGLGHFKDDPTLFAAAAEYLRRT